MKIQARFSVFDMYFKYSSVVTFNTELISQLKINVYLFYYKILNFKFFNSKILPCLFKNAFKNELFVCSSRLL